MTSAQPETDSNPLILATPSSDFPCRVIFGAFEKITLHLLIGDRIDDGVPTKT